MVYISKIVYSNSNDTIRNNNKIPKISDLLILSEQHIAEGRACIIRGFFSFSPAFPQGK